jgi:hypothetical protein
VPSSDGASIAQLSPHHRWRTKSFGEPRTTGILLLTAGARAEGTNGGHQIARRLNDGRGGVLRTGEIMVRDGPHRYLTAL